MKEHDQTFYLEIHDFGFLLPGYDDILRLKAIYPDLKITCFTVPFPKEFFNEQNAKHFQIEKYKKWAEIINSWEWMEIGLHGFGHTHFEMDCTTEKANLILDASENLFKKVGLKYKKMFCAPYWQYSYDALQVLKKRGYVVAINRDKPAPVPKGLKTHVYNWSFDERFLPPVDNVLGHGHLTGQGVSNAICQTYYNILKLIPPTAKFGFLSKLYDV